MNQVIPSLWIASSITLGCLVTVNSVRAQIVPDNTLPVNSRVTPGCTVCTIEGGTVRGVNQFHSFSEFSVPTGGEAFFNNGLRIQNIFSRVTGNSVSNIDGLLRTNGTASLFFLNPNGIIFGPNATLNIGGSFVASSANSLVFADGTVFSAKPATQTAPLLSINVPIGLQYGSNPGSVEVQGASLQVNPGQTLALAGGDVSVTGGRLVAPGGRVELAGVASEGSIDLVANGSSLGLSFPASLPRTDVSITEGAEVNVRAGGGGSIAINARNLNISGASTRVRAGIASGLGSVGSKAGDIEINATQAINLDAGVIFNEVQEGGIGDGGDINITTGSLAVTGGAQLSASTFGEGKAGSVIITARDTVAFDGVGSNGFSSGAFSSVAQGGIGDGGGINITTGSLNVTERAVLSARSFGQGNAGNLNVSANSVLLDNQGQLIAETASGGGGNINLQVEDLLLMRRNSLISAQAFNNGNGGNITIKPGLIVAIPAENSDIVADAQQGNGGRINITTQGIFGLEFRRQRTPNSEITASSQFGISGTVNVTELGVDPSQGLTALPANLVDPTNQIDQRCLAGGANRKNTFALTGRGGLPQSPNEVLAPDMVQDDFGTPVTSNPPSSESVKPSPTNPPKQLVEAQGWVVDEKGVVTLVASAPTVTPHSPALTAASCQESLGQGRQGEQGDKGVGTSEELVPVRSRQISSYPHKGYVVKVEKEG
jgi:filamentous hemagglutinin family protein